MQNIFFELLNDLPLSNPLFWLIFSAAGLVFAAGKIFRHLVRHSRYFQQKIYLVRLPKDKPGDAEKAFSLQSLREEIAKGETMFHQIGGLKPQTDWRGFLFGRRDHFAFEIVAAKKIISFYVIAPLEYSRFLEQQIQAHYPEAVVDEIKDYNIFRPDSHIYTGLIKAKRLYIFPIRTYMKMEADPVNTLINTISKIQEDEGLVVQYVARSARPRWHKKSIKVARLMKKGKTMAQALEFLGFFGFFREMFSTFKNSASKDPAVQERKQNEFNPRLTALEEEMLKGIEEKNAKAGLEVNIRVVASSPRAEQARSYLMNILNAYGQYNYYEYGNRLEGYKTGSARREINNYIYRRFDHSRRLLLNTEELTSLYHFPLRWAETPNILWLTARQAPPPPNLPTEGVIIGRSVYRGIANDIRIKREDRRRHMYAIGKSGVGKSQFMAGLAVQDILNGDGVCVIDPHGDLITDVLDRIPPERAEDVILFAPADTERPLALNLLEFDSRYPEQKTFVINEMIKIFDKLYDLRQTGGPIFEQYMRNAMLLVMSDPESGATLMEIPKVLADPDFRRMKISRCPDYTVVDFWRKEAEKAGGDAALANVVPYITSKLTQFISNDTMRPIIGQQESSFNFRDVMDKQKILLVDLAKGRVGEMNSYLLGMIMVGKILMAALSRTDMPREARKDFYLYIDEFQNFTTDSISSILSEARKYNLNLIIAHQYLGQLVKGQDSSIKQAVFGNVGTWAVFKIGSEDAEIIDKEFSPVFNKFDLINIDKYTAYVKLLIDNAAGRPFSMNTLWPLPGQVQPGLAQKIKSLSRLKFGQDRRIIEAEILNRAKKFSDLDMTETDPDMTEK